MFCFSYFSNFLTLFKSFLYNYLIGTTKPGYEFLNKIYKQFFYLHTIMKIPRIKERGAIQDMSGVWTWDQLTSIAGTSMMRNSWRVGPILGAAVGGYMGIKGDIGGVKAALTPVVSTAAMFGTGLALRIGVSIVYAGRIAIAQGNLMNLMEDYRSQRRDEVLERLWERVFQHEPFAEYSENGHRAVRLEEVVSAQADGDGKAAFFRLANSILDDPHTQATQREMTGVSWSILESWLDAGPLESGDTKIYDDYLGRAPIQTIKRHVGLSKSEKIVEKQKLFWQRQWRSFITKALAIGVGSNVRDLNREYDTDLFDAQTLLWPGEENQEWIDQFPGAREEVLSRRKYLIQRVFGSDFETARRKLRRMHNGTFELLTFLRSRFDQEYLQGSLGYSPADDLRLQGYDDKEVKFYESAQERAVEEMGELDKFVCSERPQLWEPGATEARRAVRIAFHTNRDGLRDKVCQRDYAEAGQVADYVVTRKGTYSRRLVDLRTLHELSIVSIHEYLDLVRQLGYSNESETPRENDAERALL